MYLVHWGRTDIEDHNIQRRSGMAPYVWVGDRTDTLYEISSEGSIWTDDRTGVAMRNVSWVETWRRRSDLTEAGELVDEFERERRGPRRTPSPSPSTPGAEDRDVLPLSEDSKAAFMSSWPYPDAVFNRDLWPTLRERVRELPANARTKSVHALCRLGAKRAVVLREAYFDKRAMLRRLDFTDERRRRLHAVVVQGVGDEAPSPCSNCAAGKGSFRSCVVGPAGQARPWFNGACACCAYALRNTSCSLHLKERAPHTLEGGRVAPIGAGSAQTDPTVAMASGPAAAVGGSDADAAADMDPDERESDEDRAPSTRPHSPRSSPVFTSDAPRPSSPSSDDDTHSNRWAWHRGPSTELGEPRSPSGPASGKAAVEVVDLTRGYEPQAEGTHRHPAANQKRKMSVKEEGGAIQRDTFDNTRLASRSEGAPARSSEAAPASNSTPHRGVRRAAVGRRSNKRSLESPAASSSAKRVKSELSPEEQQVVYNDQSFGMGEATVHQIRYILERSNGDHLASETFETAWTKHLLRQGGGEEDGHQSGRYSCKEKWLSAWFVKQLNESVRMVCPTRSNRNEPILIDDD